MVQRQMLFFLARAYVASAKVARRIREETRKKNVSSDWGYILVQAFVTLRELMLAVENVVVAVSGGVGRGRQRAWGIWRATKS